MTDIETILSERQSVYGDYDNVACSSQAIKCIIQNGASYRRLSIVERESLDMIANKLARIINGKFCADSWLDISGYAELVVRSHKR